MDAKLGDTVAHRFNVAEKTSFKPLDPGNHNATNRDVGQMVKPKGELWDCLDGETDITVIDRLHTVKSKSTWPDRLVGPPPTPSPSAADPIHSEALLKPEM